jgi:REP element-mobilizing transposase RayT
VSKYIHKSHNVTVLLYHIVCPAKYRKAVFTSEVEKELREVCQEISERYEIEFLEIGVDENHVHFLVQSVPTYSPTKIVRTIKSLTAREVFERLPSVKQVLWGGEFWSKGYFMTTVGRHGSESVIRNYVKSQGGGEYRPLQQQQPGLFDN